MMISPYSFMQSFRLHLLLSLLLVCSALLIFLVAAERIQAQEVFDSHGNKISFSKPFTRIISLYSAHTENICSMGGEKQLVGISRSDDFPEYILNRPKFSYREDPEKFIGQNPDLVLIRPMVERSYPEFVKKLRTAGITVISLQPTSTDKMLSYWRTLGVLTGHEKEAEMMVEHFEKEVQRIEDVVSKVPIENKPKVYFEAIHKKMKTFAQTSIGIFILETAGGINIAHDADRVRNTNIAYFGKEKLLSRGQDIDIFISQNGRMNPVSKEIIAKEPGFGAIRAVREDKIYLIEEQLVSRPTLRILEGIEKLHNIIFGNQSPALESTQ